MLRITTIETTADTASLRLEGQVVGPWTNALSAACEAVLETGRRLELHLHDVSLIDRPGLALLASLTPRGVTFHDCSPFREQQIRNAAAAQAEVSSRLP